MPLEVKKTVKQMVDEANGQIETLSLAEAIKVHGQPGVTFIDIRDPRELWRDGTIPGAINVTRGMLEMWIDPESPYAKDYFQTGNKFVFFCAGAWRSALATKTAQDMGLTPVAHFEGGFGAWKKAGGTGREGRAEEVRRHPMSPDTLLVPQPTLSRFSRIRLDPDTRGAQRPGLARQARGDVRGQGSHVARRSTSASTGSPARSPAWA